MLKSPESFGTLTEFQAVGEGYSIDDIEVGDMYSSYRDKRSCYYVLILDDTVVGCGGFAPLTGGGKVTCELRKMFLLPQTRGLGLGRRLLTMLLNEARKAVTKSATLKRLIECGGQMSSTKKTGLNCSTAPKVKPATADVIVGIC